MIAEGRRRSARPEHDFAGARAGGPHPRERISGVAAGVTPGLEMIANKDRVEADLLRETGELQQCGRTKLLGRRLVTNLQHTILRIVTSAPGRSPNRHQWDLAIGASPCRLLADRVGSRADGRPLANDLLNGVITRSASAAAAKLAARRSAGTSW